MNNHATDEQIQAYALLADAPGSQHHPHISHCKSCMAKAEQYQQIFTALAQQETAVFNFRLADAVMEKLPVSRPVQSATWLRVILGAAVTAAIAAGCIILRSRELDVYVVGLLGLGVAGLLGFLISIEYRRYYTLLRKINNAHILQPF